MTAGTAPLRGLTVWTRPRRDAVLAGTCSALARALPVPATAWRGLFFLAGASAMLLMPSALERGMASGQGMALSLAAAPIVILYVILWAAIPPSAAEPLAAEVHSSSGERISVSDGVSSLTRWVLLAGIAGFGAVLAQLCWVLPALTAAAVIPWIAPLQTGDTRLLIVISGGLLTAGAVMGLLPLDVLESVRARGDRRAPRSLPRPVALAVALAVAVILLASLWALALLVGVEGLAPGVALSLLLLVMLAVVLVPWMAQLARAMREESEERVRAEQRAEIAAHLHDSVLQTLTLMQRSALDPDRVQRLARRQERELRRWLYEGDRADAETDVRAAVLEVIEGVEDAHGARITAVVVGDAPLQEWARPLLHALREAAANAVRHSGGEVSVYAEVSPFRVEAFVRDRGRGFDPASIPPDRLGVRESILGRMRRAGGQAVVRAARGGGTEVTLSITEESIR